MFCTIFGLFNMRDQKAKNIRKVIFQVGVSLHTNELQKGPLYILQGFLLFSSPAYTI